jgi:glycosyltransferase involved in cell wall biosynthesis
LVQESDSIGLFSLYEGFPNSIIEGMACGKPVICSAVSDLSSILSYDLNLIFDPNKPQSIKHSLSYLLSLREEQLQEIGLKNLNIVKQLFNRENSISGYLELFKN